MMSSNVCDACKTRIQPVVNNAVHDLGVDWLELEFVTQSRIFEGQISCPAGMRILDMLNTPCSPAQNAKVEFIELKDHLKTDSCGKPGMVCIKKEDILFVSAPDANMGRGLGAKGEFKLYPFVPKTPVRVSIELPAYSITGNLFRAKNQIVMDVLNDEMFFIPLTDVTIGKDGRYVGERPFVAVNKRQINQCSVDGLL